MSGDPNEPSAGRGGCASETIHTAQSKRIDALMRDHRLTPSEKCVARVIFDRLCSSGVQTARISVKDISAAVRVSERKVQIACGQLNKLGYLIVHKHHGQVNRYSLPELPDASVLASAVRPEVASGLGDGHGAP
jgi:hypothetical protein